MSVDIPVVRHEEMKMESLEGKYGNGEEKEAVLSWSAAFLMPFFDFRISSFATFKT